MWKCPNCEEIIEEISYSCEISGYESGTAYLSKNNQKESYNKITEHEYNDSSTEDSSNYRYECPECSKEIEINDLKWEEEEEEEKEKETEPEESLHNIIKPTNYIISDRYTQNPSENVMVCKNKKCKHVFVYENKNAYAETDEFFECPKCSTINSKIEHINLMKKNE